LRHINGSVKVQRRRVMTERKRPDPRLNGLPDGYDFQYRLKPHETEEEAISRVFAQAEAGARLLRDPDFNAAFHEIMEEQIAQFVGSKPGQSELRDDCYFRVRGIQEIAYKLSSWVAQGDQLRAHLENRENTE
jgi:hypothetical protein